MNMHQISLFTGQGAACIPRSSLMQFRGADRVDGKNVLKNHHCSMWKRLRQVTLQNVSPQKAREASGGFIIALVWSL